MTRRHLNGWRRLWIVVALITLVGALLNAASTAINERAENYEIAAALSDPSCDHIRTLPKGFVLDEEPAPGSTCYRLYHANRFTQNPIRSYEQYQTEQDQQLLSRLGAALVVWGVGIALLYGVGVTAAWVRRGFRAGPSGAP